MNEDNRPTLINEFPTIEPRGATLAGNLEIGKKFQLLLNVAKKDIPVQLPTMMALNLAKILRGKGEELENTLRSLVGAETVPLHSTASWWVRYIISELKQGLQDNERDNTLAGPAGAWNFSTEIHGRGFYDKQAFSSPEKMADFCSYALNGLWEANVEMMGGLLPLFWLQLKEQDKAILDPNQKFLPEMYTYEQRLQIPGRRWLEMIGMYGGNGKVTDRDGKEREIRLKDYSIYLDVGTGEEKQRTSEDMRSARLMYYSIDETGKVILSQKIITFNTFTKSLSYSEILQLYSEFTELINNPEKFQTTDAQRKPVFEFAIFSEDVKHSLSTSRENIDLSIKLDYKGVCDRAPVARVVLGFKKLGVEGLYSLVDDLHIVFPHYAANADAGLSILRKFLRNLKSVQGTNGALYEGLKFTSGKATKIKVLRREIDLQEKLNVLEIAVGFELSEFEKKQIKIAQETDSKRCESEKNSTNKGIRLAQLMAWVTSMLTNQSSFICVNPKESDLQIAFAPQSEKNLLGQKVREILSFLLNNLDSSLIYNDQNLDTLFDRIFLQYLSRIKSDLQAELNDYSDVTAQELSDAQAGKAFLPVVDTHSPDILKNLLKATLKTASSFLLGRCAQISSFYHDPQSTGGEAEFISAGSKNASLAFGLFQSSDGKKNIQMRYRFERSDLDQIESSHNEKGITKERLEQLAIERSKVLLHESFRIQLLIVATICAIYLNGDTGEPISPEKLEEIKNNFVKGIHQIFLENEKLNLP